MDQSGNDKSRAKAYQKIKQKLTLIHLGLTLFLLWLVVVFPFSQAFKEAAASIAGNRYAMLAVYFVFFSLFMMIFYFPFSFYSGYTLEHRYGLSNQTRTTWFVFFLKAAGLSFVMNLGLIQGFYALIWHFPSAWWFYAWIGYAAVSYVLGKIFPVFIVPLFYQYGPVPDEDLRQRIFRLAERYAMPVKNVYSLNLSKTTKKANAAFLGFGKTKRVILSDTLMEHFTPEEIEIVVAHELGHYRHHDMFKHLAFGLAVSLAVFAIAFCLLAPTARFFGFSGAEDVAGLPVLLFIGYVSYLVMSPALSGFSRYTERAADKFALGAVPLVDAFISCMEKLARVNLSDPEPNPVYEWFFYDHPAIGKRIRKAREWAEGFKAQESGT